MPKPSWRCSTLRSHQGPRPRVCGTSAVFTLIQVTCRIMMQFRRGTGIALPPKHVHMICSANAHRHTQGDDHSFKSSARMAARWNVLIVAECRGDGGVADSDELLSVTFVRSTHRPWKPSAALASLLLPEFLYQLGCTPRSPQNNSRLQQHDQ